MRIRGGPVFAYAHQRRFFLSNLSGERRTRPPVEKRKWALALSAGAKLSEYKGTHCYRETFNLGKLTTSSIVEASQAYQCTVSVQQKTVGLRVTLGSGILYIYIVT